MKLFVYSRDYRRLAITRLYILGYQCHVGRLSDQALIFIQPTGLSIRLLLLRLLLQCLSLLLLLMLLWLHCRHRKSRIRVWIRWCLCRETRWWGYGK